MVVCNLMGLSEVSFWINHCVIRIEIVIHKCNFYDEYIALYILEKASNFLNT